MTNTGPSHARRSALMPAVPSIALRPFRDGDQPDLVRQANNANVARHLRERFPQPYTPQAAEDWIALCRDQSPALNLAITSADRLIGSIGLLPGSDSSRASAEVGYWLGEDHWGRGIATLALHKIVEHGFRTLPDLNRIFAYVDEGHTASLRVLEKNGFRREGHLLGATLKRGELRNLFLYAITRHEAAAADNHGSSAGKQPPI